MIKGSLENLAFPWLLLNKQGDIIDRGDGSLFELDPTSVEEITLSFIKSNVKENGWYICP